METNLNEEKYYLQDSRTYVGNDMMFWAIDSRGYTTDLNRAHIFTKEEAVSQHQLRETDIPWPKNYIDRISRPAVDFQYADAEIALQGTGIALIKKTKKVTKRY